MCPLRAKSRHDNCHLRAPDEQLILVEVRVKSYRGTNREDPSCNIS